MFFCLLVLHWRPVWDVTYLSPNVSCMGQAGTGEVGTVDHPLVKKGKRVGGDVECDSQTALLFLLT